MQVILLENVMKLGKIGDQVEVKNGFARNYLLRQGKALRASKENIELVSKTKVELKVGKFERLHAGLNSHNAVQSMTARCAQTSQRVLNLNNDALIL